MNKKLSIVIPMYRVEQYIQDCLDSVFNNELSNLYEVIIVNDGSPDDSLAIAQRITKDRTNVTILSQENAGLSAARNAGLKKAVGEYVWFVDSDDYIPSYAIEKVIECANGCDIINIGYQEDVEGKVGKTRIPEADVTGKELIKRCSFIPAQFHIFRRQFLEENNLCFYNGIFHEDIEFTNRAYYLASNIGAISEVLYYYRIRGGSIMTVVRPKRAFDCLTVCESLIHFSNIHQESFKTTPFSTIICMTLNNALYIISQADKKAQKEWLEAYQEKREFNEMLINSDVRKYKLEGYMFKYLPFNKIVLYNILQKLK